MTPPGYVPKRVWWKDRVLRLIGNPNLMKRLQYADIMRGTAVRAGEVALDFGCGSGYFTYELARQGAIAHGLDIAPVDDNVIPPSLEGRLFFHRAAGGGMVAANYMYNSASRDGLAIGIFHEAQVLNQLTSAAGVQE